MNRALPIFLIVLGGFLLFKTVFAWSLFLVLALAFGLAAGMGAVGRWGYAVAVIFGLLAIPGLLFSAIFKTIWLLIKFFPVILILLGVIWLLKPGRRY